MDFTSISTRFLSRAVIMSTPSIKYILRRDANIPYTIPSTTRHVTIEEFAVSMSTWRSKVEIGSLWPPRTGV